MKLDLDERKPWNATQLAVWFALTTLAVVAVSSLIAAVLAPWLEQQNGAVAEFALSRGPAKLARRIMTVLAIPCLVWLVRRLGWEGWRDGGWSQRPGLGIDPFWRGDLWLGAGIGIVTFAMLAGGAVLAGTREAGPSWTGFEYVSGSLGIILTAVVVALIEETIARGILLRLLARPWSWLAASLFSSMLFAYAHFMEVATEAFQVQGVWGRAWAIGYSTIVDGVAADGFALEFVNMTIMSCVLCFMFVRTRTVWLAVGTHAAWAGMRLFNAELTDKVRDVGDTVLFGKRAGQTDSLAATLILLGLLALLWRFLPARRRSG